MPYDSARDTEDHIDSVREYMSAFYNNLRNRAIAHDQSKLESPEKEVFDIVTPRLRELIYGSDEYKAALGEMGEALTHHYEHNSHHPEHYPNGIDGMDLLDLVEMICDWRAAGERHKDGSILKSLEINRERFGISDQLYSILVNTVRERGWL